MVPSTCDISNRTRDCLRKPLATLDAATPRFSAASAALDNPQIALPLSNRAQRWEMRKALNARSKIKRLRDCGRVPLGQLVSVRTMGEHGHSGIANLESCSSVWACPVCSARISRTRQEECAAVMSTASAAGKFVSMLTLTQRHTKAQSLAELWDSLSYAWGAVTSGRRWIEYQEQLGVIGWLKSTEVTHGKNGWHVHVHVCFVTERDPRIQPILYQRKQGRAKRPYPIEVTTAGAWIADRWKRALARKGVDFIAHLGGMDWQVARDAEAVGMYVGKLSGACDGLSAEMTLGGFKKGRKGNRTPFQIFGDYMQNGDSGDLALWYEWEKQSRGKKALIWSKNLRSWAKLEREKTDQEIIEEDLGGETVAVLTRRGWWRLREVGAGQALDILDSVGREAFYDFLAYHGVEFRYPPPDDFDEDRPPDAG